MRTPKPYFKTSHKAWYVNLHGKNVRLGEDEKAAWQEYHILMAQGRESKPTSPVQAVLVSSGGQMPPDGRNEKQPF